MRNQEEGLQEEGLQKEGLTFGNYKVIRLLGRGGMATVCLAEDMENKVLVALKVLDPSLSFGDPEYAERFLREIRIAQRLSHPNIVSVIGSGKEGNTYYMVMEYIDGPTCKEKVEREGKEGKLPWQEAVKIVTQVAQGLEYANGEEIIHRDINPSNIMIDSNGTPRITDLGLAKKTTGEVTYTRTGTSLGTAYYLSPEQIHSARTVDFRSDIYSLGATLYHLICGSVPYTGTTFDIMTKHTRDPLPSPKEHVPDLPDAVCDVIKKMMAKSADDRYQSYEQLIEDFGNLLGGKPVSAAGFQDKSTKESPMLVSYENMVAKATAETIITTGHVMSNGHVMSKIPMIAAIAAIIVLLMTVIILLIYR